MGTDPGRQSPDALLSPWSGVGYRHIPKDSEYGPIDFRFAGLARDNRWNHAGEPTFYLAGDLGVAIGEYGRHFRVDRPQELAEQTRERSVYAISVVVDALLDLRDERVHEIFSLRDAPHCFLDKGLCRRIAREVRERSSAQALLVPSMAFLDDTQRWVMALFLEKLPTHFVASVEHQGTFTLRPGERSVDLWA